jgi:hypothetical protein
LNETQYPALCRERVTLMRTTGISIMAGALVSCLMLSAPAGVFAQADKGLKTIEPGQAAMAIECEDMQGVTAMGTPGGGWKFAKWGTDLLQNNTFGGHWSSRMANAMSDPSNPTKAEEVYQDVRIDKDGKYKVWAKFECPPFFNYPFGIKVQKLEGGKPGATVFDKTYGLREGVKHYSFNDKPKKGDLYWTWGMDHDAAEGFETDLAQGDYRVVLYKAANVGDTGPRSVDAILITSNITDVLSPKAARFPMLADLQKLNHCYFRFTNTGTQPVQLYYNRWQHRYDHFYNMYPVNEIRFYGADGKMLLGADGKPMVSANGQWTKPLGPGESTPWIDLGPTMTTENSNAVMGTASPLDEKGQMAREGPLRTASQKLTGLRMDIATEPSAKAIVKTYEKPKDTSELGVIVMPDLHRAEGQAYTVPVRDGYAEFTRKLNTLPTVGPLPKKIRMMGYIGSPVMGFKDSSDTSFPYSMEYNIALGLNTVCFAAAEGKQWEDVMAYYRAKGQNFIEFSAFYQHTKDVEVLRRVVYETEPGNPKKATDKMRPGIKDRLRYVSYGDEIGIPSVDTKDPKVIAAFRAYLKDNKVDPAILGFKSLDEAMPLTGFTLEALAGVGIVPKKDEAGKPVLPTGPEGQRYKALYWWTHQFSIVQGCLSFAELTVKMRDLVGPQFHTTANLGGMHPFYWMHQSSFIEAFRHKGMTLAWSEDYDYTQPEASRLCVAFLGAYLRAGAKYHDTPMQMYVMPHYPGNSGRHLLNNVISLWGQGSKDVDWFSVPIDGWTTENYLHTRGGVETGRVMRAASGMAGNVEDALMPARVRAGRVAILLSEASDLWEVEGIGQSIVAPAADGKPATVASNASQEERKATWYALRKAGYQVDLLTENDVAEGRLAPYKALYVCGQNLDTRCVPVITDWVKAGGTLVATAGAARKDQYDQPLKAMDALVGRGEVKSANVYRGPLRAKLELLFLPSLGKIKTDAGVFEARATREDFVPTAGAQTLATFEGAGPAVVSAKTGAGTGYYIGTLPGQAMLFAGMPKVTMGKGGPDNNPVHFEPETLDPAATALILEPLTKAGIKPDVVTGSPMIVADILEGPSATVLTVNRLSNPPKGWKTGSMGAAGENLAYVLDPSWPTAKNVKIVIPGLAKPSKVFTALKARGVTAENSPEGLVVTLPELDAGDVVVLVK